MRASGAVVALALVLAIPPTAGTVAAWADDPVRPPSRADVREARDAVRDQERDVATVQAELLAANQRLQESAVRAAQASEAWNGARYRLEQARRAARAAEDRAGIAHRDVTTQRQSYADAVVDSYQDADELSAVAAIAGSEGISSMVEQTTTLVQAEDAMDTRYDGFRAASTLADVAEEQAVRARADAAELQQQARRARDAAAAAADAAAVEADRITERKTGLISELAELQDISVGLAEQRQSALEEQALREAAAVQAREAALAAEEAEERTSDEVRDQAPEEPSRPQQSTPQTDPDPAPAPQPPPQPAPQPAPGPPAPSGGAGAAIGFARAQIGEPYQWGAAGPGAWDCSGLTMGAWRVGGKYLPHYSVAQYEQSTPISSGALRPGDLVFWGSSSSPSSIYHVALYAGNGRIIHAPRTGRPVTEESMYYWIPPNFHARP